MDKGLSFHFKISDFIFVFAEEKLFDSKSSLFNIELLNYECEKSKLDDCDKLTKDELDTYFGVVTGNHLAEICYRRYAKVPRLFL